MAGATVVGGGFLIEKQNDAGRAFLSGYQIPLESLANVSFASPGSVDEHRSVLQMHMLACTMRTCATASTFINRA